jgi:hypothetical protein
VTDKQTINNSKLLSGFPWHIIFKQKKQNKMKLLMEYERVIKKFIARRIITALPYKLFELHFHIP